MSHATSLPARERGSKQLSRCTRSSICVVAPRAGAWIETMRLTAHVVAMTLSLPARERGSKHVYASSQRDWPRSLPARERGSKHHKRDASQPHRRRRSPRGSVDRNAWRLRTVSGHARRRSPRGSVDRNLSDSRRMLARRRWSLPARERGSKRMQAPDTLWHARSLPARERGSKLHRCTVSSCNTRRSPRGSVDRN